MKTNSILKSLGEKKAIRYAKYLNSFKDKHGLAFYMCFDAYQLEKKQRHAYFIFLEFWKKYLIGTNYGMAKYGIGYNKEHPSYQRETIMFWVSGLTEKKEKAMVYKYENTHEGLFPCQKYFRKMMDEEIQKEFPSICLPIVDFEKFSDAARLASLPAFFIWDNKNIYERGNKFILLETLFF